MKKVIIPLLMLVFCTLIYAQKAAEPSVITIGVPKAPPALPLLRMQETMALGKNITLKLDIWSEPETLIAMTQDNKHDMFAFPLTVVAKLYNKGVKVKLMNVNTWGAAYFLTSDPKFKSWQDLKGKTVYAPLQSSPPDIFTRVFLSKAHLIAGKDVKIINGSQTEIAALLISGKAQYGIAIEPMATKVLTANKKMRRVFGFEEEWQRVNNSDTHIPNAGFGASVAFIEKYPDFIPRFQKAYEEAIVWINEHPAEAGALAEKHLGLPAKIVEKAIPNMGLQFKAATQAGAELEMFYRLLFGFDPKTIGGKIPDSGMYYNAK